MGKQIRRDNGVAGLTILLSVVVTLFIIGLLVAIFAIMGGEMETANYLSTTLTTLNETTSSKVTETPVSFTNAGLRDVVCTVLLVQNRTTGGVIDSANYTVSGCTIRYSHASASPPFNNSYWNVSYSYTWNADTEATLVMNDTVKGIVGVTDWFDIFIVITAMVVLILLTVIIITAIRSSGMIAGGNNGARDVGTA